jgi:TRAP-type C4-dicarboxylate transport system permease large subunit
VPMPKIFRGIMPFLAAMLVLLVLLTIWPNLALILPRQMG